MSRKMWAVLSLSFALTVASLATPLSADDPPEGCCDDPPAANCELIEWTCVSGGDDRYEDCTWFCPIE